MVSPIIKWTGSKRSQAEAILNYFPEKIEVYYEPFVGGGSILMALMQRGNCKRYICSDLNADLINVWKLIKESPERLYNSYTQMWTELKNMGDIPHRREYFNAVRTWLNAEHRAEDFFFIMRTTTNGLPRYNRSGDFNNSLHLTRDGIEPKNLAPILSTWSDLLRENNVEFYCCSYETLKPEQNAFMYLDPPYAHTKGIYFGNFDFQTFFQWLRQQGCGYALSFDGKISSGADFTVDVPTALYMEHHYISSGLSSFRRLFSEDKTVQVYDSLYLKY